MGGESKHQRAQRRSKTTTYKLVHRSYEDPEYSEENPVMWVTEADLRKNHKNTDRPTRRVHFEGEHADEQESSQAHRRRKGPPEQGSDEEVGEWLDGDWTEDDEGEWLDEEDEDVEEGDAHHHPRALGGCALHAGGAAQSEALEKQLLSEWGASKDTPAWLAATKPRHLMTDEEKHKEGMRETEKYRHKRNMHMAHDEDGHGDDDALFEDAEECEVTDDFLQQLVFGEAEGAAVGGDSEDEDDEGLGDYEEDGEIWRLLTEEEKEALRAARHRGTARRRKAAENVGDAATTTNALTGEEYPTHDVTQRAVDRQFTQMMREFDVDARINDADMDDPRTHGALSMNKYLTALEEFVVDRAGVDLETSAPTRNKGLIQQLKFLAHQAGAFDSDQKGVYLTTTVSDKQTRFVEEFRQGTAEIRALARQRVLLRILQQRQMEADRKATEARGEVYSPPETEVPNDDDSEEMVIREVRTKADRLDCETAVSTYSTYFNQPNVIRAPSRKKPRLGGKKNGHKQGRPYSSGADSHGGEETVGTTQHLHSSGEDEHQRSGATAVVLVPTVRDPGETKEEKKLRRQAVKAAQRDRRQEKSALKKTYKNMEGTEAQRATASANAKRTVHFL